MPSKTRWTWILIVEAVVAVLLAIWIPYKRSAHAAGPSFVPEPVFTAVDDATKPSPFPEKPGRHSRKTAR
jgi:hypothetical protein